MGYIPWPNLQTCQTRRQQRRQGPTKWAHFHNCLQNGAKDDTPLQARTLCHDVGRHPIAIPRATPCVRDATIRKTGICSNDATERRPSPHHTVPDGRVIIFRPFHIPALGSRQDQCHASRRNNQWAARRQQTKHAKTMRPRPLVTHQRQPERKARPDASDPPMRARSNTHSIHANSARPVTNAPRTNQRAPRPTNTHKPLHYSVSVHGR